MDINAQTLVLIDNSFSVSNVNREITKLTLQYLFSHTPEGRAYCFSPFSHEMDYAESYTTDYIGLEDMAYRLEYENKETSITDVLTGVLDKWEQSDFACRDIVIFTDGKEEKSINYEKEELYYMLEHASYPVYIVCLDQENNKDASKNLSVISRLSGGKLFHTEFEGSDAEVERQLSEQLLDAMNKYSCENWTVYESENENSAETGNEEAESEENTQSENNDEETIITDVINEENFDLSGKTGFAEDNIIYETQKEDFLSDPLSYALIGGSLFLMFCGVFLSVILVIRRKRKIELEDEQYRQIIKRKIAENQGKSNHENDFALGYEMEERTAARDKKASRTTDRSLGQTVALVSRSIQDDESGTRLLNDGFNTDISFEDANDPSKYYRVTANGMIILGRNPDKCDLAFEYDDSVSAKHCQISIRDGRWYVKDMGSSNGTSVNGEKVYTESVLRSGDLLQMGSLTLIVRFT